MNHQQNVSVTDPVVDRCPPLARALRPIMDPEVQQQLQHFIEELAARTERNIARQISEMEQRMSPASCRS